MEGGGNGRGHNRKLPPVLTRQLSVIHRPKDEGAAVEVGGGGTKTLANVLAASEKRSLAPSMSNRSLIDVIRNESTSNNDSSATRRVNWKTFKDRLILRRTIAAFSSTQHQDPPAEAPDSVAPTQEEASDSEPPRAAAEPVRVSLMALLEQADRMSALPTRDDAPEPGKEAAEEEDDDDGEMVHVCCVCMVRHKGAAFIPCGHTFCRLCSRELWVSRGNCPLCNGFILEILDIF